MNTGVLSREKKMEKEKKAAVLEAFREMGTAAAEAAETENSKLAVVRELSDEIRKLLKAGCRYADIAATLREKGGVDITGAVLCAYMHRIGRGGRKSRKPPSSRASS